MASSDLSPYMLFTLTDLIGKQAANRRTTVIATVETPLRTAIWLIGSLVGTSVLALILGFATPIGQWALLIPLALTPAITVFANGRSRRGLQLTHMQRTFDRLNARASRHMFVHMDRLYDPLDVRVVTVTRSTVDVDRIEDWPERPILQVPGGDDDLVEDATYVKQPERTMSTRSARAAAEDRTRVSAGLLEAQREDERARFTEQYERRLKDRTERITRGEMSEEEAA